MEVVESLDGFRILMDIDGLSIKFKRFCLNYSELTGEVTWLGRGYRRMFDAFLRKHTETHDAALRRTLALGLVRWINWMRSSFGGQMSSRYHKISKNFENHFKHI